MGREGVTLSQNNSWWWSKFLQWGTHEGCILCLVDIFASSTFAGSFSSNWHFISLKWTLGQMEFSQRIWQHFDVTTMQVPAIFVSILNRNVVKMYKGARPLFLQSFTVFFNYACTQKIIKIQARSHIPLSKCGGMCIFHISLNCDHYQSRSSKCIWLLSPHSTWLQILGKNCTQAVSRSRFTECVACTIQLEFSCDGISNDCTLPSFVAGLCKLKFLCILLL